MFKGFKKNSMVLAVALSLSVGFAPHSYASIGDEEPPVEEQIPGVGESVSTSFTTHFYD